MILTQKEIINNSFWVNVNVDKSGSQVNEVTSKGKYYWLKLYKGPFLKFIHSWVGIDIDKSRFLYLSLFVKYFFGVRFLYGDKFVGRDNKKLFQIIKAYKEIKKNRVTHYINLKEELLSYLKKGKEVEVHEEKKEKKKSFLFRSLEMIFNKRLSDKFALFFPIMNARFFIMTAIHKSLNFITLNNV